MQRACIGFAWLVANSANEPRASALAPARSHRICGVGVGELDQAIPGATKCRMKRTRKRTVKLWKLELARLAAKDLRPAGPLR